MAKTDQRHCCRQCGKPLPKDSNRNTYLCVACRKLNEKLRNQRKNREWYEKNKEKRKAAYRLAHPKKLKSSQDEKPIRIPSAEEIRANVDRLLEKAAERERMSGFRRFRKRVKVQSDTPVDSTPRTLHSVIIAGREFVVETRGVPCCGCNSQSNRLFDS